MNEQFCKDLAHTFGITLEEQTDALAFHDNDGHEWILECAPQSEILFFIVTYQPTNQIKSIKY
ncbi:chaperone CesF [Escherichia coli DEC1A]|uniref:Chaperone CesF n=1 Tax=Escherichia coli DEC2D TaxID=868141 RepID=A0A828U2K5_ECOLX|nr:chaperone CesF [Escherichia coli DEC1A]EHU04496.1 chaperone CesF [Escherichia coli DEC1C]EHU23941.1 type III secretion system, chaperone for EspF,LEE associated [Escherichia coli DEC2A]EHU37661.1 chaperone CesF [Escherichia coli DEC2C]EHU39665.1 chaperone CesF [Escherichia coli DEC2D]